MNGLLDNIEDNSRNTNFKMFYQKVNRMRKKFKPRISLSRNKKGGIINDKHGILSRWEEHFSGPLNNITQNDNSLPPIAGTSDDTNIEVPTIEEIRRAIIKLKNNKAASSDIIPTELLKQGGEHLTAHLQLISNIWVQGELPSQWKQGSNWCPYT